MAQLIAIDRGETLADQVYEQLRKALLSGQFKPGERMTIRTIAAQVSVSPTPAREALTRLAVEGALEFGPNRTVQVPSLDEERISEIYRLRVMVEGMAAETAAERLTAADLRTLDYCQDNLIDAMDRQDFKAVLRENEMFHFTIYRAAGLPSTLKIIESLWLQCGPCLNLLYPKFEQTREGIQHHLSAIRAAQSRNADELRAAIESDLTSGRRVILHALAQHARPGSAKEYTEEMRSVAGANEPDA